MQNTQCPLCRAEHAVFYHQDKRRQYYQCQQCELVFADRTTLLSKQQELSQYQLHQNELDDPGYRRFLQRLATPLLQALAKSGLQGLDFGCGPGPLLAKMLTEAGQHMSVWDPFFAPDPAALKRQYDFICCTEAIEHFVQPCREWTLWLQLLKSTGTLAIMTKRYTSLEAFANWHYKTDPTHVSFFSEQTFRFIAQRDGLTCNFVGPDVVILRRQKH